MASMLRLQSPLILKELAIGLEHNKQTTTFADAHKSKKNVRRPRCCCQILHLDSTVGTNSSALCGELLTNHFFLNYNSFKNALDNKGSKRRDHCQSKFHSQILRHSHVSFVSSQTLAVLFPTLVQDRIVMWTQHFILS